MYSRKSKIKSFTNRLFLKSSSFPRNFYNVLKAYSHPKIHSQLTYDSYICYSRNILNLETKIAAVWWNYEGGLNVVEVEIICIPGSVCQKLASPGCQRRMCPIWRHIFLAEHLSNISPIDPFIPRFNCDPLTCPFDLRCC